MGAVSSVLLCSAPSCGVREASGTLAKLTVGSSGPSSANRSSGSGPARTARRSSPGVPARLPPAGQAEGSRRLRLVARAAAASPAQRWDRRLPPDSAGRGAERSAGPAGTAGAQLPLVAEARRGRRGPPRARGPFPTNISRVQAWGTQERSPNSQGLVASGVAVVAQCEEFVRLEDSRTALSIREPLIICGYLNLDLNLKTKILFSTHHISSAEQPYVARDYCTGQKRYKAFPLLHEVVFSNILLDYVSLLLLKY